MQPEEAQPKGPQAGPSGRCARPRLHSGVANSGPPLSASPSSSGRPIDGATEPFASSSPLATRWSRSPLHGAPLDPLNTRSSLV